MIADSKILIVDDYKTNRLLLETHLMFVISSIFQLSIFKSSGLD